MRNGRQHTTEPTRAPRERALIAALRLPGQRRWEVEESLDELAGLAAAAGATVVHRVVQERRAPAPALHFGRGKIEEIGQAARATRANLVITDDALTPVQERNMSQTLGLKV
ncbi:MAG TPA: GTPase HflX, partial [Methylomirabilota bacterium]|nr:GTPase HflX [Methylomirabilota bacterium]